MNVCKLHSVALDRFISLILSSLLGKMENILPTQQCVCGWWWGVILSPQQYVCGSTSAILTRSSTCLSIALQRKTDMSSSKDCSTLYGTCAMPAPPPRDSPTWKENVLEIAWTQTKYLIFVNYLATILGHSFIKGAPVKMKKWLSKGFLNDMASGHCWPWPAFHGGLNATPDPLP